MTKRICPTCKGKGHVYDPASAMVAVVGWILAFMETNDPNGLTREWCRQCSGKGYVIWG